MFEQKIQKFLQTDFSKRGALVDANLLLIILVSKLGVGEVEKFKRTRNFTTVDAYGALELISLFGWICTTSHIATEVSNLLDWIDEPKKTTVLTYLAEYIRVVDERQILAKEVVEEKSFYQFGLTDASIAKIAFQERLVLITADLPLYGFASRIGVNAINFNNIREVWL